MAILCIISDGKGNLKRNIYAHFIFAEYCGKNVCTLRNKSVLDTKAVSYYFSDLFIHLLSLKAHRVKVCE